MMVELKLSEIRVSVGDTAPVVVLAEVDGSRRLLPIWMSHGGAAAILGATEDPDERRPSIHDLVSQIVADSGGQQLTGVQITDCQDGQFFADLVFGDRSVSARPSDAIALALRLGCPIRCEAAVLDEYGVAAESQPAESEAEVERFLEFLDTVTPDDFSGGEGKP